MNVGVLRYPGMQGTKEVAQEFAEARPGIETPGRTWNWSPDDFAREQLRGLVQRIFFSGATHAVRQVVISAAEARADVTGVCRQVGEMLSTETAAGVVIVAGEGSSSPPDDGAEAAEEATTLSESSKPGSSNAMSSKSLMTQLRDNLWLAPGPRGKNLEIMSSTAWYSRLCELRREFEYSIVEGPPAGGSSEAAVAAQLADGMILVLTAHATRRATVQRIQETLKATQTRLLGAILAERRFPIPEAIYRRL
jgi:polysaccharide biosynthesis transport protein